MTDTKSSNVTNFIFVNKHIMCTRERNEDEKIEKILHDIRLSNRHAYYTYKTTQKLSEILVMFHHEFYLIQLDFVIFLFVKIKAKQDVL